jgi:hypothetical protein
MAGALGAGVAGGIADALVMHAMGHNGTADVVALTANFGAQMGFLYLVGGGAMTAFSGAAAPLTVYGHFWGEQRQADMSRYATEIQRARMPIAQGVGFVGRDTAAELTSHERYGRWMLSWMWGSSDH